MKLYHAQNEEDHRTCAGSHHPQREIPVQPQNSPQSKRLLPWKWAADAVAGRVSRRWGLATANCSPLPQEEIQIRPRHRLPQPPVSSSRQSSFHSHTRFSAASTLSQEEPRTPTNKATKHPNQTLHHSRNMYRGSEHFWREKKEKNSMKLTNRPYIYEGKRVKHKWLCFPPTFASAESRAFSRDVLDVNGWEATNIWWKPVLPN